jgi:type II secretory pathway pseudopilin PulG
MTALAKSFLIGAAVLVLLALMAVGALLIAGIYGWQAAQRAGNEAAAIQDVKTIAAVEIQYYNTHNRTFGTIAQLIKESMLTSKFSGDRPVADGYVFDLKVTPRTKEAQSFYTLYADPQSVSTGTNHFYIDSRSADIHTNQNQPAGATDPSSSK